MHNKKFFNLIITLFYALTIPRRKRIIKKKGVGTYCFILRLGLRITFSMDKTIAHTKGYV